MASKSINVELRKKNGTQDLSLYPVTYASNVITGNDEYLDSFISNQIRKNNNYDNAISNIDGLKTNLKQYVDESITNKVSLVIGNEVPNSLPDDMIYGLVID